MEKEQLIEKGTDLYNELYEELKRDVQPFVDKWIQKHPELGEIQIKISYTATISFKNKPEISPFFINFDK
jgi:hypothetical protein